jgi:hypothetical protein
VQVPGEVVVTDRYRREEPLLPDVLVTFFGRQ